MKIPKAVALVLLIAPMHSFGAVEATLFHITTNETFTVPTGKVLIIENVRGPTEQLILQSGTNSFRLFGDPAPSDLVLPVKIPGGWTLRGGVEPFGPPDIWVFGLLVDSSDLFASLQHRIDRIAVNGNTLSLGIQTASTRPVRIKVEKSAEVDKGWQTSDNAVVAPTTDKTRYVATVPMEGDKGFVRTKARPLTR